MLDATPSRALRGDRRGRGGRATGRCRAGSADTVGFDGARSTGALRHHQGTPGRRRRGTNRWGRPSGTNPRRRRKASRRGRLSGTNPLRLRRAFRLLSGAASPLVSRPARGHSIRRTPTTARSARPAASSPTPRSPPAAPRHGDPAPRQPTAASPRGPPPPPTSSDRLATLVQTSSQTSLAAGRSRGRRWPCPPTVATRALPSLSSLAARKSNFTLA
jgi:hypothetical protein